MKSNKENDKSCPLGIGEINAKLKINYISIVEQIVVVALWTKVEKLALDCSHTKLMFVPATHAAVTTVRS